MPITDRNRRLGPYPFPDFPERVAEVSMSPVNFHHSGNLTTHPEKSFPAPYDGRITDVWMSCGASGKDDSNDLSFTMDVRINGTTALTTQPIIAHVSGEASQHKTTLAEAADTGITAAVVDATANSFNAGDIITLKFTLTRTSSPTTEICNPVGVVEMVPDF